MALDKACVRKHVRETTEGTQGKVRGASVDPVDTTASLEFK